MIAMGDWGGAGSNPHCGLAKYTVALALLHVGAKPPPALVCNLMRLQNLSCNAALEPKSPWPSQRHGWRCVRVGAWLSMEYANEGRQGHGSGGCRPCLGPRG